MIPQCLVLVVDGKTVYNSGYCDLKLKVATDGNIHTIVATTKPAPPQAIAEIEVQHYQTRELDLD